MPTNPFAFYLVRWPAHRLEYSALPGTWGGERAAAKRARSAHRFLLHELSLGTELLNKLLNFPFPFWARLSERLRHIATCLLSSAGDVQHPAGSAAHIYISHAWRAGQFSADVGICAYCSCVKQKGKNFYSYLPPMGCHKKHRTNEALYNKMQPRLLL